MMVMLVIMIMGSAAFLVSALNSASVQIARDRKTADALAQAKEALIGYAMNSENDLSESKPRPGNLPCPDTDAPNHIDVSYGVEEGSCAAGAIGRLPWKSLGIPELVDDAGEPLWYAVSGNFRRESINSNAINSDTQGSLLVYASDGSTLLTPVGAEAIAVIFSPSVIVGNQQRSSIAQKKTASNYLEIGSNSRNNATIGGPFITGSKNSSFNDRLIYITTDQLFPTLEKRVAKEVETSIKPMLNTYKASWGAFPFAESFSRPSTSTFIGQASTYNGLLPIGNIVNLSPSLDWKTSPTPTYDVSGSGGDSGNCGIIDGNTQQLRCPDTGSTINIDSGRTITISATLNDAGKGFWKIFDLANQGEVRCRESSSSSYKLCTDAALNLDNVSVTGTLNANGSANIRFSARAKSGGAQLNRVELRNIQSSSTGAMSNWFLMNNWHQLLYYGTSVGYAPAGTGTCAALPATPSCLTVVGSGGGNDKQSVLVMMNKALPGKTHTTNTRADYLEDENATPTDFIYENKARSATFNDQVIIVAP